MSKTGEPVVASNSKVVSPVNGSKDSSDAQLANKAVQPVPVIHSSLPPNKLEELDLNDLAVEIRNLTFTYDKKKGNLLDNINMTFPKGAIYGFLGPSGCGKSTLIKLIVGRLKPSAGTIRVNGRSVFHPDNKIPGVGIGYMPQEYALYGEFTILETMNYFSKIYGLSEDYKKKRIEFLIKFLDLPDPNRVVHVLSGGQKRRMSLAVAVIHNPPILILDEPTVGVDPMLRERVWEHLVHLSNEEKTSILLTTHYIEECRRAHIIALMRTGKILVENAPAALLTHFMTDNLEDVFLKACRSEEKPDAVSMPPNVGQLRASQSAKIQKPGLVKVWSNAGTTSSAFGRYTALAHKNFMRLWRQKLLFICNIFLPVITISLICICLGKKPKHLDIAFNNQEIDPNKIMAGHQFSTFISSETINLIEYSSNRSAIESVEDGKTYGALIIGKNFSQALKARSEAQNFNVSEEVLQQSTVQFSGDLTNIIIYQTVYQTLIEAEFAFLTKLVESKAAQIANPNQKPNPRAMLPLVDFINPPVYGSLSPVFLDFGIPGLLVLLTYTLSMALVTLNMVVERKTGLLERTQVAGVKTYEILIAEIAVQHIVLFIQTFILMITIFYIFKVKNEGNIILIALMAILQGGCGMAFGLFISAISPNEETALMLLVGSVNPYLVISGIIWPLEGMNSILRTISVFTPQTLPIISLRSIMLKGWGLGPTLVWAGYLSTILWLLIFVVMTVVIYSVRKD